MTMYNNYRLYKIKKKNFDEIIVYFHFQVLNNTNNIFIRNIIFGGNVISDLLSMKTAYLISISSF